MNCDSKSRSGVEVRPYRRLSSFQVLLHAFEQSLRWIGHWPQQLDFCKSGIDVAVADVVHPRSGKARSPAYTFAAMEEHGVATDVLSNGIHDCIELTYIESLGIFDRNMNVTNVPPFGGYARFAQRNDRRNTVQVRLGEFIGISEAPEPQSLPNSRHSARSRSLFFLLRALSSSPVGVAGGV